MHAYFDSPETIRNKIKEFKTATIGGLNRQDVMNYLSILSEQQGVMIRLLRENNIPLFVDDGYEQEEQFMKPMGDGQDGLNLNQYLGFDANSEIAELQAEIEALKAENENLKLQNYNQAIDEHRIPNNEPISDFDAKYGLVSSDNNTESLLQTIEEKDLYIKELENALQNESSFTNNGDDASKGLSDIERQAYEEEILTLRTKIESLESTETDNVDLFERDTTSLDEDTIASYEKEIESLKLQLEEALLSKETNFDETVESTDDTALTDFDLALSETNPTKSTTNDDTVVESNVDVSREEIEELNSTIDSLNKTIEELKSELEVCHELLDEHANAQPNLTIATEVEKTQDTQESLDFVENNTSFDSCNDNDEIEKLKTTIEILELEVGKREKEKANVEIKLAEANEKLARFTNYKDDCGNPVVLDPDMLAAKYNEIVSLENKIKIEKDDLESKLNILREKEQLIEANKHLVSEDFVNNITRKEQEIESLRKQMDKMLLVAQVTADETEKEANEKAAKLLEQAKSNADVIVSEAISKKEALINEANETLNSAKEFKASTEEELIKFREETRQNAEDMIMEAQNKANLLLEEAKNEAQQSQENALREVEDIMAKAEQRVSDIEVLIQSKQKEIDNMQTYYLKVKNDGLVRVKQLYNQLENIIYSDEIS